MCLPYSANHQEFSVTESRRYSLAVALALFTERYPLNAAHRTLSTKRYPLNAMHRDHVRPTHLIRLNLSVQTRTRLFMFIVKKCEPRGEDALWRRLLEVSEAAFEWKVFSESSCVNTPATLSRLMEASGCSLRKRLPEIADWCRWPMFSFGDSSMKSLQCSM